MDTLGEKLKQKERIETTIMQCHEYVCIFIYRNLLILLLTDLRLVS